MRSVAPEAPGWLVRKVFALLGAAKVTERRDRLNLYQWIMHDPSVMSTDDLNQIELDVVANTLEHWQRNGELEVRAREAINQVRTGEW